MQRPGQLPGEKVKSGHQSLEVKEPGAGKGLGLLPASTQAAGEGSCAREGGGGLPLACLLMGQLTRTRAFLPFPHFTI